MEFSKQEYWSGLPFPYLGDLSDPGVKSRFDLQAEEVKFKGFWDTQSVFSLDDWVTSYLSIQIWEGNQPESINPNNARGLEAYTLTHHLIYLFNSALFYF